MTPELRVRRIARIIERYCIDSTTEAAAQKGLEDCLTKEGCAVQREVRLNDTDRIDLMADGVSIEVKVKGAKRRTLAQVERYMANDAVVGLILVTAKAFPMRQAKINGKPFEVVDLSRAWL